jgi:ubiquinone/menaquinone biosynthesis C-methylase UbiE
MPCWRGVGRTWNDLGARNPLGAILTRGGVLPTWTLEEFLATGRADAARFMADLERLAPTTGRRRALDFGCGIGRIARALTDHFDEVVGVDAAASMIHRARQLNADCKRCTFVLNRASHLRSFPSATFDVVYSRLVLQHIRPSIVRRYVPELIRVLAPGGALMFQLPEFPPVAGSWWKKRMPRIAIEQWRRTKHRFMRVRSTACVEMFGIDRAEVEEMIHRAGGRLLAANADRSHGAEGSGFEYWVTSA